MHDSPRLHVHVPSIGWKVADKPLETVLILFIVSILQENVLHTCHYKEDKNILLILLCLSILFTVQTALMCGSWNISVEVKSNCNRFSIRVL